MTAPLRHAAPPALIFDRPEPMVDLIHMLAARPGQPPEQHNKHVRAWQWNAYELARAEHERKFR
jgi:hypothetical protein